MHTHTHTPAAMLLGEPPRQPPTACSRPSKGKSSCQCRTQAGWSSGCVDPRWSAHKPAAPARSTRHERAPMQPGRRLLRARRPLSGPSPALPPSSQTSLLEVKHATGSAGSSCPSCQVACEVMTFAFPRLSGQCRRRPLIFCFFPFAAFLKLLEDCSTGLQHVKCGNARLQGQNSKIRLHRGAANTFSLPKQVRLATPVKWSQICLSGAAAAFWVRKR